MKNHVGLKRLAKAELATRGRLHRFLLLRTQPNEAF